MPDEKGKAAKSSVLADSFIGILCFVLCTALSFLLAGISRGFSTLLFWTGFIGLAFVSAKFSRPGFIIGFISAIVLSIVALFLLIWSICGGSGGWGHYFGK